MKRIIVLALSQTACFYISDYVPPVDGRARVVWRDNRISASLNGHPLKPECSNILSRISNVKFIDFLNQVPGNNNASGSSVYELSVALDQFYQSLPVTFLSTSSVRWRSVYYVAKREGLLPNYPIFDPQLLIMPIQKTLPMDSVDGSFSLFLLNFFMFSNLQSLGFDSRADSSGTEWSTFRPWVRAASLALAPFVGGVTAMYPLLDDAGSPVTMSHSANLVNAYNDLARTEQTPCFYRLADVTPPVSAPRLAPAAGGKLKKQPQQGRR